MLWRILWRLNSALLALMVACTSTPHAVRVEQRQHTTLLHLPRSAHVQPLALDEEEFRRAVRQLAREVRFTGTPRHTAQAPFQLDPLSGNYLYLRGEEKLVPTGDGQILEGSLSEQDLETAERYRLWCKRVYGLYGDCLGGALVAGRYLDVHGRYVWALALSKSPVL
ncbi:MAG TPA: hypothetical protein VEZ71_06660, partial [Archangium sp.]|nr:hypothetical protein [Archangium sp.]